MESKEHHRRSVVKSITFRVVVLLVDYVVIFAITRRHDIAIGVLVATNLASTILYYLHERVWARVSWGRR